MTTKSMGEVVPGLWVGDLMSIREVGDLVRTACVSIDQSKNNVQENTSHAVVTVISVLSNPNLLRFVRDSLEQQRLRFMLPQQNDEGQCQGKASKQSRIFQERETETKQINENTKVDTAGDSQNEGHLSTDEVSNNKVSPSGLGSIKDCLDVDSIERSTGLVPIHQTVPCDQIATDIRHVVIPLKDSTQSDLSAVLPDALNYIDEALGVSDCSMSPPKSMSKHEDHVDYGNQTTEQSKTDFVECRTFSDKMSNSDSSDCKNDFADNSKTFHNDNPQRLCLVHCAKGASRSVSIIIAYLLSRHPQRFKNFDQSLNHVRSVRPQALPNVGFALTLRRFEKELRGNR